MFKSQFPFSRKWKLAFKHAAKNKLPPSIINRPKWGFGAPLKAWMSNGLQDKIYKMLKSGSMLEKSGLMDGSKLTNYLNTPRSGEVYRRDQRLWSLFVLEIWLKVFVQGKGKKPTSDFISEW